jgi:hypothetical protein
MPRGRGDLPAAGFRSTGIDDVRMSQLGSLCLSRVSDGLTSSGAPSRSLSLPRRDIGSSALQLLPPPSSFHEFLSPTSIAVHPITMHFSKSILALALAAMPALSSPLSGIINHLQPLDVILGVFELRYPALVNLHSTPTCGQICQMDPQHQYQHASLCMTFNKDERFACLCRSSAYQYALEQCYLEQCSDDEIERVRLLPQRQGG